VRPPLRLAALLLLSGCSGPAPAPAAPADNTADLCARWVASTKPFLSRGEDAAPETTAYRNAMSDAYAGKEMPQKQALAIQRAYWGAQEKTPRALAAEATSPHLREAFTNYADELAGRSTDVVPEFTGSDSPVLLSLTAICGPR
jgi:hypothetical protein